MEDFTQMQDDLDLNNAFNVILSIEKISGVTNEIAKLVKDNLLTKESLEKILHTHNIKTITDLKEELLDLILVYVNIILNDNALSQKELRNVKLLKMFFQICVTLFVSFPNKLFIIIPRLHSIFFLPRIEELAPITIGLTLLHEMCHDFHLQSLFSKLGLAKSRKQKKRIPNLLRFL